MSIVRVELDGLTTSFRYPHFLIGRQPSFPMPPPATILGHVASALGEYPDRRSLRFAYSFSADGRVDDMEKAHITEVGGSVPREDRTLFPYPVNVSVTTGPLMRELLVHPRLVLYLDAPGWVESLYRAFREPRYMVIFGRSQDLASYRRVDLIDTAVRDAGYVEGTLLHQADRERFPAAAPLIMPRYIDPEDRRRVDWAPYLTLQGRNLIAPIEGGSETAVRRRALVDEQFEIDPESPVVSGLQRILYWHRFADTAS